MLNSKLMLLLLIVVLLVSCVCESENNLNIETSNNFSPIVNTDEEKNLVINRWSVKEIDEDIKKDYINAWEDYMKTSFGIKVELNLHDSYNYQRMLYDFKNIEGLFVTTSQISLNDLFNEENFYSIDEMLKENNVWNSYPESFRNTMRFNGRTIAIPNNYNPNNYLVRYFKKEAIKSDDFKKVISLDHFYKLSKTQINDDYISIVSRDINDLIDIYNAFGIMTGYRYNNIFWNTESNKYEDNMNNEYLEKCLQWISKSVQEGIISLDGNCYEKTASVFGINDNMFYPEANYMTIEFIYDEKYNSIKPSEVVPMIGYVISKSNDYEKAKYMVNNFVDVFYGSELGLNSGKYGIMSKENDKFSNFSLIDSKIVFYNNEDGTKKLQPIIINKDSHYMDYYSLLKDNIVFTKSLSSIPFDNSEMNYGDDAYKIFKSANSIVTKIILGEISFDDGINEYTKIISKGDYKKLFFDSLSKYFED